MVLTIPAVGGNTLSTSGLGRFMVFVYIWLPFMILPVQAALERLPPSLLQASADLGARPQQTFRYVVLPLAIPGIAAGSILPFPSPLAILLSRNWWDRPVSLSATWSIRSRARLAICRWQRRSRWCRLF